jgi:hypothetical protein
VEVLNMKSNNILHKIGLSAITLILTVTAACGTAFSAAVSEGEAIVVADLWYSMEVNSEYSEMGVDERALRLQEMPNRQIFYLVDKVDLLVTPPVQGRTLAYVVTYKPSGYVVVTGDDRILSIVVFDTKTRFRWDIPQQNFLKYFLGRNIPARWQRMERQQSAAGGVAVHPMWAYLRAKLAETADPSESAPESPDVLLLHTTALWDQGNFYNDTVIANNGNTAGIPTGCTATAMAIKMRFHEWPATGVGSRSYTDISGSIRFSHAVNFAAQSYNWLSMPITPLTSANTDVADLMYHCGVAVSMDYEVGLSGAWPTTISMHTYFRYKGTTERNSGHETPIADSILARLPVVLSSGTHTVVADGYRDTVSPYYHINAGWNGANNGWYNLDQIPGSDNTIDRSYPYGAPNNHIFLDSAWTGSENGNLQNPFNTLSEGTAVVPQGGHLRLRGRSYSGVGNAPITITKAMTISGFRGTATIGD